MMKNFFLAASAGLVTHAAAIRVGGEHGDRSLGHQLAAIRVVSEGDGQPVEQQLAAIRVGGEGEAGKPREELSGRQRLAFAVANKAKKKARRVRHQWLPVHELNTQLIIACADGEVQDVEALLERGANVDAKIRGRTALHHAIDKGHVGVVTVLIRHGANANALHTGQNALHYACFLEPLFQEKGIDVVEVVNALLKANIDVNAQNDAGETALQLAREGDNENLVNALVAAGAQ